MMARFAPLRVLFFLAIAALVSASLFGSEKVYNAWHETQLEKWLDDHKIPFPHPADRKELENIVSKNYDKYKSTKPYEQWDETQLKQWLESRNIPSEASAQKDALAGTVKSYWYDTADKWDDAKDWVFNTWSESDLKSFLDKHGIPNPNPRSRDAFLSQARDSYGSVAAKASDAAEAPGNWVFDSWTDSDLKAWADARGIPVPQGSKRNELVSVVRKSYRDWSLHAQDYAAWATGKVKKGAASAGSAASSVATEGASSASSLARKGASSISSAAPGVKASVSSLAGKGASAASSVATDAASSVSSAASAGASYASDYAFDTWSDSDLKAFADKNNIPVPQGSKKNQLVALLRKNAHALTGTPIDQKASKTAASAFGAATSNAGNIWNKVSTLFVQKKDEAFDAVVSGWSDSDIKAFLDKHSIPVPQNSKRDELTALARRNAHYYTQTSDFKGTGFFDQVAGYMRVGLGQAQSYLSNVAGHAYKNAEAAGDYASEKATAAKHRAEEAAQSATHKIKEEL